MPLATSTAAESLAAAVLQTAVEYGAAVSGTGGSTVGGSAADQLLAQWNAVVPVRPWVVGVGAVAVWLFRRGRGSGSGASPGLFGTLARIALVVGALYLLARWRGIV